MRDLSAVAVQFETQLLAINRLEARAMLLSLHDDSSLDTVIEQVVVPALERIGTAWNDGEVSLAQVFMAGRICEDIITALIPAPLRGTGRPGKAGPRVAIAVVQDYHLLGKRIVSSMLSASGFHIYDYGGGLSPEKIVARVGEDDIDILLLSALMLPSALKVKQVVSLLSEQEKVIPVVVGGAPFVFDDQLWKEVGADAMGRTASDAIAIVTRLVKERTS